MSIQPPPINHPVVDETQMMTQPWILYNNQLFQGDPGTPWTPNFVNLTVSGTPTITGTYYKIGQSLCYISVRIVPGTNTSAVAGTTYIDNFPLDVLADGAVLAVSGGLGSGAGMIQATTNRIYVPAWTTVTVPLTIVGMAEI